MLMSLILWLIVLGLVWWLVGMLPLPDPIQKIINVVFIIVLIFVVLSVFGVTGASIPMLKVLALF